MRRLVVGLLMLVFTVGTAAFCEEEAKSDGEDILIVCYASLVGGRNGGNAPVVSGVLSREDLSDYLLEWTPGADNQEVQSVFALNDLGELARQAAQLPLDGGVVSGIYALGDSSFEIGLNIRPARTIDSGDDVMTVMAEIKRDGELVSSPVIHTRLGERAIITAAGKDDGPFLVLGHRDRSSLFPRAGTARTATFLAQGLLAGRWGGCDGAGRYRKGSTGVHGGCAQEQAAGTGRLAGGDQQGRRNRGCGSDRGAALRLERTGS